MMINELREYRDFDYLSIEIYFATMLTSFLGITITF